MFNKKVYIQHCDKCGRFCLKQDRGGDCPPEEDHTEFNERLARGEVALPFIPDYKKGENYPQRAINLKGEPVVKSYEDYRDKCKAEGLREIGISDESHYRMKHKIARKNRQVYDLDPLVKKMKTEDPKPKILKIKEPGKQPVAL